MTVRLEPITRENWRAASRVRLKPGQLSHVADHEPVSLVIMAKALVREGGFEWFPLAILDEDRIVGVVALVDERTVRGGFALFHLVIDAEEQGRGLGRAAMRAAIDFAREFEDATTLRLLVSPRNTAAIRLYESLGFQSGQGWDDELGMVLAL